MAILDLREWMMVEMSAATKYRSDVQGSASSSGWRSVITRTLMVTMSGDVGVPPAPSSADGLDGAGRLEMYDGSMRLLTVYSSVAYGRLDSVLSSSNGGWEEEAGLVARARPSSVGVRDVGLATALALRMVEDGEMALAMGWVPRLGARVVQGDVGRGGGGGSGHDDRRGQDVGQQRRVGHETTSATGCWAARAR